MARMQRTPRYPMGTRIKKHFPGYAEPFAGTVDQFTPASGFYHITYDDGDSEEMTEDDVQIHFFETVKPRGKMPSGISPHDPAPTNIDDVLEETVDGISDLVGQKLCKKQAQADGTKVVVSGSVASYFPATKMYRVVYLNGTTEDMTYREVVDCLPLVVNGASSSKNAKRQSPKNGKASEVASNQDVPSTKKRKGDVTDERVDKAKKKKNATTDENNNRGNTGNSNMEAEEDVTSVFDAPASADESVVVWNKSRAYETVRAVLFVVSSTSTLAPEAVKALEQKGLKAKLALTKFVELEGLTILRELLTEWVLSKDHEAGVLAVLKVLTVLPGVTVDAIRTSDIGRTMGKISKGKGVAEDLDPVVTAMARYVVQMWKALVSGNDTKPVAIPEKVASKKASDVPVPDKKITKSDTKADTNPDKAKSDTKADSSNGSVKATTKLGSLLSQPRSKSASHLSDLMGGRRSGDVKGQFLGRRTRPLGSTVLMESLANRQLKNSEAQKRNNASGTTGNTSGSAAPEDGWVASRVRFGETSAVEFYHTLEVVRLRDKPSPGVYRPVNPESVKLVPSAGKQPGKSILKVKMGTLERDAIYEKRQVSRDEADADDEQTATAAVNTSTTEVECNSIEFEPAPSEASGNGGEPEPPESRWIAPPSPPRRRNESDEENHDNEEDDGDDLPDDIMIVMPSEMPGEQPDSDESPTVDEEMEVESGQAVPELPVVQVDEDGFFNSGAASPEVSSDAPSSPESGEEVEAVDDVMMGEAEAQQTPASPTAVIDLSPPQSSSPPPPSSPPPSSPPSLSDLMADSTDEPPAVGDDKQSPTVVADES